MPSTSGTTRVGGSALQVKHNEGSLPRRADHRDQLCAAAHTKITALSRSFGVSNAAEPSTVPWRSVAAPRFVKSRRGHALLDRGCGPARTAEVWSHSPQYSPRLAAQASRSCSQAGFLAVHAPVRAPPAPYWVRAPLPRTTPRPWARVGPSDETGRCRLWT